MARKKRDKLSRLEDILKQRDISLIYEAKLDGKGGVCTVKGKRKIIINNLLPDSEKIELLEEIIKRLSLDGGTG